MNRPTRLLLIAFSISRAYSPAQISAQASGPAQAQVPLTIEAPGRRGDAEYSGVFLDGRWEGTVDLGDGRERLVLRLFSADPETGLAAGGLVDLPARKLFGYPIDALERDPEGLSFTFLGGAPIGGALALRGSPDKIASGETFVVSGTARLLPAGNEASAQGDLALAALAEGPFSLSYAGIASRGSNFGSKYSVDTGRGILPGSLLLPSVGESGGEGDVVPVVLFLSGAASDRDGDNYAVPGRSDALAELAIALRDRGLASLRFDKRGTGEAYRFAEKEEDLRFEDHVDDARIAISELAADKRFSGVAVLGYSEGALAGAAALAPDRVPGRDRDAEGRFVGIGREALNRVVGIVSLCATGRTELEIVQEALSSTPEELMPEAQTILLALERGGTYSDPSPYFADYFRPSAQPYLASLFRYDLRAVFASVPFPALVIAGGSDLQVGSADSRLLAIARPDAAYRVIPGMSHALKKAGDDEDTNYASFTNPSIPLAAGLADLIAAFAKGEALP